ncbi:hypothetical protein [Cryptosporangium japonicum]|uniref:DNA-binding protein n=1 Tax=Cryptosporangium japonicum TaxID=80872 RepID=A0ABN0UV85_9ACTN
MSVDVQLARSYQHPVLDGRTVVRLVPATLAEAEDLSMEFLGFSAPLRSAEVGTVARQALGFPAWALVNDPANGHHALALVKEIERLARIAKSRVGPAKEGFDELGRRLGAAVPHFLPTYYEEAGRAFIAADSPSYGAMMFGKAREAEQTYALAVDDEREHAVFLEFALAGALTVKALTTHARALAVRSEPAEAYSRFRRLCVERTLGGLAPYAGMAADLRRLAKAAGIDQAEADADVLRELLSAPTLQKAPEPFWKAYRAALVRLAADEPAVRGRLLTFFPEHMGMTEWLETLAAAGATEALTEPAGTVDPAAEPTDGVAGWFERAAKHRDSRYWRASRRSAALYALLERAAPRLAADGVALRIELDWQSDLDLYDTALALGLPVADPSDGFQVNVDQWLEDDRDGRRDLAAFAADPRFLPSLVQAVESALPRRPSPARVEKVLAAAGLRVAVAHFLDDLAEQIVHQGLPTLEAQLQRLDKVVDARLLALNPAAAERIRAHDLAPVLGRTLRSGLVDEYGWPALEEYVASSVPAPRSDDEEHQVVQVVQWPHLVLRHGLQAAVLDGSGVVLEHHLRIPADERSYLWLTAFRYVDGQLLVSWDTGPNRSAYWSGTPSDVLTGLPFEAWYQHDQSLPLPDGGRTSGGRPLRAGDRSQHRYDRVFSDGVSYWAVDDETLVEYDPATGERGRASMPAFFEAGAVDGERIEVARSVLRPFPGASPFGQADGLVGWRLRTAADGASVGTGIDGRTVRLPAGDEGTLVNAIRFPGSDAVYGLVQREQWRENTLTIVSEDGFVVSRVGIGARRDTFAAGTPLVPRAGGWYHLRPRDPAGSAALRAVTDEQAATLLAAASRDHAAAAAAEDAAATVAARRAVAMSAVAPGIATSAVASGAVATSAVASGAVATGAGATGAVATGAVATGAGASGAVASGAGAVGGEDGAAGADGAALPAAVAAVLPEVTHPELIAGLVGVVAKAAERAALLAEMSAGLAAVAAPTAAPVAPERLAGPPDGPLMDGLTLLIPRCYDRGGEATRLLTTVARALVDGVEPPPGSLDGDHDWFHALRVFPAALYRSVSPLYRSLTLSVARAERDALLDFAELIADSGLLAPGSALRRIHGASDTAPSPQRLQKVGNGFVLRLNDDEEHGNPPVWTLDLLEFQPDGEFGTIPGLTDPFWFPLLAGFDEELVRSFVATARERGPIEWRPELVDRLSQAAGLARSEALLLLYGLIKPGVPVRDAATEIGVPPAALDVVDDSWEHGREHRAALVGALLPTDPRRIFDDGPDFAGVADWFRVQGRRAPIADSVLVAAHQARLSWRPRALTMLNAIRSAESCPWLAPTPRDASGQIDRTAPAVRGPDPDDIVPALASYLPWLAYHLPADDDFRQALPVALRTYRARLGEPEYEVALQYLDEEQWAALAHHLGATPVDRTTPTEDRVELGPFVTPDLADGRRVRVRPGMLSGPDDPALRAFEAVESELAEIRALRVLLSDWLPRLLEGAAAVDPAAGAPQVPPAELVTEAASVLSLSEDAATVYLQLLALPDPTDKNVARWTGWKPARLKKARAELAATPLVTEAKRARAGRTLFLPGGWLALKAPRLPVETWKLPLHSDPDRGALVPLTPIPELFAAAWARVRRGDEPRFDELRTGRRR